MEHLQACHDVQLPDLVRDRHVFAFEDGVYLAASDSFAAYGTPAHAALPTDLVAAKYFAMPFSAEGDGEDDGEDWYRGIPTPHLQSILDYQEMGDDVRRWMYALIGRLIYEVGEMDGWQVIFSLRGWGLCRAHPRSKRLIKTGAPPLDPAL